MDKQDEMAIRSGVKVILDRKLAAFDDFAQQIARCGEISTTEANRVAGFYLKHKLAKWEGHRYVVKHGAFFDREVIGRAVTQMNNR